MDKKEEKLIKLYKKAEAATTRKKAKKVLKKAAKLDESCPVENS